MTICRFFQQGRCARGNTCNFEHIQPNGQGFGNQAGAAGAAGAAANKYK
jgi:nucleoporin NUP42